MPSSKELKIIQKVDWVHVIFFAKVYGRVLPKRDVGTCLFCLGWPALASCHVVSFIVRAEAMKGEAHSFKTAGTCLGRLCACRVCLSAQSSVFQAFPLVYSARFLLLCKRALWVCISKTLKYIVGLNNGEQDLKHSLNHSFSQFRLLREVPNPPWHLKLLSHPHDFFH